MSDTDVVKSKIRMNELARELKCKANDIIAALPGLGVARVVTHSSSISFEEAEKVRKHFVENPDWHEPKTDHVTLGHAKSIAARFGEEI